MKPLFRWIIGDVSQEGFHILSEAVRNITTFYKNDFDFLICSNAENLNSNIELKKISKRFKVDVYQQSWTDLPIDESFIFKKEKSIRDGTFWKICPPRMRLESHEIICDNDIVFTQPIKLINEFLEKNIILMMKEDAFCAGKYFKLFNENENYNSGFYGLPPNYDFEKKLKENWENNGRYNGLLWRDEQGLVTSTLKKEKHITIESEEIIHLFSTGRCYSYEFEIIEENKIKSRIMKNMKFKDFKLSNKEKGYHFLGANRERHDKWIEHKRNSIFYE
ncbi:MAG: hypothetical protein EKK64_06165 [Neisseriaceae bacterium]|nr:MAG: hypothetical protein EKK64_06165 [Neisseriaceae bacterium]